ncbi:hypothetical protein CRV24_010405 [Beauveria bassiana]|nr:hypothetical protein CRV24_010405 [Beauveria bassiana]
MSPILPGRKSQMVESESQMFQESSRNAEESGATDGTSGDFRSRDQLSCTHASSPNSSMFINQSAAYPMGDLGTSHHLLLRSTIDLATQSNNLHKPTRTNET